MKNSIPYTSFHGISEQVCAKGNAVEFIQPWYTPISTTPENTGIAVGGIGNTFTLTPLGDTPSFAFIPGIFIDNTEADYHFNDFYVSVAEELTLEQLDISDFVELGQFLHFYPALFSGARLSCDSKALVLYEIKQALKSGQFYQQNASNFAKWNIEFNEKTRHAIQSDGESLKTQLLVAMDFFNGLLINKSTRSLSLTASAKHDEIQSVSAKDIAYQTLYPLAEFAYSAFEDVSVHRKVVSPIVRGDKKRCSLPMHWNEFEVSNNSNEKKVVTLVQSLKNLIGSTYLKQRPGVQDSACTLTQNPVQQSHQAYSSDISERRFKGVIQTSLSNYQSDIDGEVLFGADVEKELLDCGKVVVSVKPSVYCVSEEKSVVAALGSGRVNMTFDKGIYSGREALASLVTIQIELDANESVSVRFAQVMDHAKIQLQGWLSQKAYVNFYPKDARATAILEDTLPYIDEIEASIITEQSRYLAQAKEATGNEKSALKFATMAMNSLSFLAESSVWDVEDKFLVKECVDYPFFNSLDVYFYGSFSLLYLLPELDGCVMREFGKAILAEDNTKRRFWEYEDKPYAELVDSKYEGTRGVRGAVIHDLGSPFDIKPDAYTWHNVKEWKDLAPKYILMVYRHYKLTGDIAVVEGCWQAVKESIEYLTKLIAEGDDLPLTRGTDDTFDNLSSHGISIYCASLWVAGLYAAAEIAKLMQQKELAEEYTTRGNSSLATLERGLWDENKGYFHFFVTPIQLHHLTGEGYQKLESLGLKLTGNRLIDKDILNEYLDSAHHVSNKGDGSIETKLESRLRAKQQLAVVAPRAFSTEYQQVLTLDSDNSFGDAMLADSYLKLLGMEGLFEPSKVERTLDYIYQTNFKVNSPKLGVANMTLADGMPHEAFQAQDVWIGVQFSVATSLRLANKNAQAVELMDTVYDALYHQAKIPFAAPEGFNCSVTVNVEELARELSVSTEAAQSWFEGLALKGCLLADGRVNPDIDETLQAFSKTVEGLVEPEYQSALHTWLKNTGLKYTAGRYFRPGMIFAYMPEAIL